MKTNKEYAALINEMEPCKAIVLNVQEVSADAVLVIFDYNTDSTTAAVVYDDDTIFTLWDWQQGDYPKSLAEIAEYKWRLGVTDEEAIMIN